MKDDLPVMANHNHSSRHQMLVERMRHDAVNAAKVRGRRLLCLYADSDAECSQTKPVIDRENTQLVHRHLGIFLANHVCSAIVGRKKQLARYPMEKVKIAPKTTYQVHATFGIVKEYPTKEK